MKAVLQILRGYFSFLPLQRWINIVGAALLLAGLALTLWAPDAKASIRMASLVAMPGAFLIALLPLALGGMALRFASSPSLLYLRPHGRFRMLLGSTLMLAVLAAIITLPILAENHVFRNLGLRQPLASARAARWFLGAGAFAAAAWLMSFVSSSSRWLFALMPMLFGVIAISSAGIHARASSWVGGILAAWVPFALWYSQVARIKRPDWMNERVLGLGSLAFRPLERLSTSDGTTARSRAVRQFLLGSESSLAIIAAGVFVAILVLTVTTLLPQEKPWAFATPSFLAIPFTIISATVGQVSTRRARHLWLRGFDRTALFGIAERSGLPASLMMFGGAAAILLVASIVHRPDQALHLVLYVAMLGILAVVLFYFGLSLTRGWNAADVFCGVGLFVLAMIILIAIKSREHPSAAGILIAAGVFALLALLLRGFARQRWRVLDWRVAKLPRPSRS